MPTTDSLCDLPDLRAGHHTLSGRPTELGVMAAEVVARAALHAVQHASGLPGRPRAAGM